MSVRSGQSITTEFTTRRFDTGAATNADSTPTGTLYVNGTADAATVTVTNQATGKYKAAVTLPTLAFGDVISLVIAATVNSVTDNGKVWEDTKDIAIDSSGQVLIQSGTGTGQISLTAGVAQANVTKVDGVALITHLSGAFPADVASVMLSTDAATGLTFIGEQYKGSGYIDVNLTHVSAVAFTSANVGTNFNTFFDNDTSTSGATVDDVASAESAAVSTQTRVLTAIPNVAAGSAGGLLIAGSNAATTFAAFTSSGAFTITGALTATNVLNNIVGVALSSAYDFAKGNVAMTESYSTDGATKTPIQALYEIAQMLQEASVSSTTMTVKKVNGSTTAMTLTLNDATDPTSITRTS